MKKILIILLSMLLQGIGCLESQAASLLQPSYYHLGFGVRNISMNNGLPANAVRSIVQDKRGFMWFGTDNGLCSYDGRQVQRFMNPDQKFDQFVSDLLVTDEGLMVGMSHGAYLFSFRTQRFSKIMGGAYFFSSEQLFSGWRWKFMDVNKRPRGFPL